MEKLTIQHIAPYFPYALHAEIEYNGNKRAMINGISFKHYGEWVRFINTNCIDETAPIDKVKPILYPISCLTKTIQHGNESFVPLVKLAEMCWDGLSGYELHHTRLEIITRFSSMMYENAQYKTLIFREGSFCFSVLDSELKIIGHFTASNQWQLFQKLAEWHINFVGIPEHLIINKETLK